jgi:hypothetical protein
MLLVMYQVHTVDLTLTPYLQACVQQNRRSSFLFVIICLVRLVSLINKCEELNRRGYIIGHHWDFNAEPVGKIDI